MNENKLLNAELNDEQLETIAGGAKLPEKRCPVHQCAVSYYDSIHAGGNLTRYKCPQCTRLYSLPQVQGVEDLTVDYTDPKNALEK